MSERSWKTSQRRPTKVARSTFGTQPKSATLNSIQESSVGTSSKSSVQSSNNSRASKGSRGSSTSRSHDMLSPGSSHSSEDRNVYSMLEDEHLKHSNANAALHAELEREIEQEIGDTNGARPMIGNLNCPNDAVNECIDHDDDDDESEDGPVIFAQQQDDDDFSQITSSIAGNTLYSNDYIFSSVSFPNSKFQTNGSKMHTNNANSNGMPSLDGTDSGGSGESTGSKPKSEEGNKAIMHDDDFERFFGTSSQNGSDIIGGATGPHRRNPMKNSSFEEDNGLADNAVNIYNNNSTNLRKSSSASDEQRDDITLSDIYSYAPSMADPARSGSSPNGKGLNTSSSNPLIVLYNFSYNLFNSGRWNSRRKKDDDLDEETIDDNTDYFATIMSADFLNSPHQPYPWSQEHRKKKRQNAFWLIGTGFFIWYLIAMNQNNLDAIEILDPPKVISPTTNVRGASKANMKVTKGAIGKATSTQRRSNVEQVNKPIAIKGRSEAYDDQSHNGIQIPDAFENFADVGDSATDTLTFFWHIPRTAGATVNDILSLCGKQKIATNIGVAGGHHEDTSLQVVDFSGHKYINVDVSNKPGIERALQMGFASSDLTDVAISSLLHDSAPLFRPSRKGKMFAFFRHPVDRVVSMFFFMQDTVWKSEGSYNKELADIPIENFFAQRRGENNWHVRFLTNQLTKAYVTDEDFQLAKEVLRRKCLVGLLIEKEESMERFSNHFGWNLESGNSKECTKRKLEWDWSLRHPHEVEIVEGNRLWNLIVSLNEYDMKLYEYARVLFDEQSKYFPK